MAFFNFASLTLTQVSILRCLNRRGLLDEEFTRADVAIALDACGIYDSNGEASPAALHLWHLQQKEAIAPATVGPGLKKWVAALGVVEAL